MMNPIEQIAQWIEDKEVWWRHAVRLILKHGELQQPHIDEVYRIARMSHGLEPATDDLIDASVPLDFTGFTHEQYVVNLTELSEVKGVGVLAKDQALKFSTSGLFIVYGDNGAGKSSYASILKNACLTRGDDAKILGNVFEDVSPPPSAKICFEASGRPSIHVWDLKSPSAEELKSIRVFDSSAAHHYVSKEDSLGFKPAGLNVLTELTGAINQIKAFVEEDTMSGNGLMMLATLNSTSPAAEFVNNLSEKSEEAQLVAHKAQPEEIEKVEPLRNEINRDKTQTAETKRASLNQQKELLTPLFSLSSDLLRYLGDKAFDRLKELQIDYSQKQQKAEELKRAILNDLPLDTIVGVSWQTLWNAAKSFIEQEPKSSSFPPVEGDSCPLCLQEISSSSQERMETLSRFLADGAATSAKKALSLVTNAITQITSQAPSLNNHKAALIELEKLLPGSEKRFEELFQELSKRKPLFIDPSNLPETIDALDISVLADLKKIIESISLQYENIQSDADMLELIKKKEAQLLHFEDRQFVLQNNDAIVNNIRRYKTISRMNALGGECNTRQVSSLSSQINQESTVKPLIAAFTEELSHFGFIRFEIKAKTRNKSGHQQFKLEIEEAGEPISSIASEGEQRCIAIAAFLAEIKADDRKSAIIFDDPVNSLSHQWRSKVAGRLVTESFERQIIVFTHDIVFYKLLLEAAESQSATHGSSALERSRRNDAGIVRQSAPWEALTTSKRLKALEVELKGLKKIDQDGTDVEFRRASREFYGRLRESWERLIEEKLLNKVVNRFERGIQTQRLRRLTDITDNDISIVDSAMGKCSTYFTGHDSAAAVGDPYPTIEEIEVDLKKLGGYLEELQGKKRKRT